MLTYGRRRPRNSPAGDYKVLCWSCQAAYYRSRCTKDRQGRILCPTCPDKRDEMDLADEIAARAAIPRVQWAPRDGGQPDPEEDP